MTKHRILPFLLLLATPAFAQQMDFTKATVKPSKVGGNVYVITLEGAPGGNIGVSVGDDGVLMVDDQWAPLAPKIKEAIKGISDKPLKFVINTHHHADHTNGNQVFGAEAPIIAHQNVRKHLETQGIDFGPPKPAPKQALPVITFEDKLSVHINGEEIRAIHFAPGHTDGDSVIWFTQSKVVHMGDDFVSGAFPYIDVEGGGTIKGMIAAQERAVKELPADVKLIPGHGPVSDINGLKQTTATLKEIVAVAEKAIKSGKTADQAKKDKIFSKWAEMGKAFVTEDMLVDMLYQDLGRTAKAAPAGHSATPKK